MVEFCTQLKQQGLLARNMQSLCSRGGSPRHNLRIQGLIFLGWLCVWIRQTLGQEAGRVVYNARVGESITMDTPLTVAVSIVSWYRGTGKTNQNLILRYIVPLPQRNKGPQHTGRETLLTDGSLHIRDLRLSDAGDYIVVVESIGIKTAGSRQLEVHGEASYVNSNMVQSPEVHYENRREGDTGHAATQAPVADSVYLDLSHQDQAAYEQINRPSPVFKKDHQISE
ncbi:carcinoembryonic antigen-related cell adhesion molecule 1-like isoform X3 [Pleurodeles waltl]|uniref:carcinoembryonic antigen-related cell adhesion molecule 1-like isoform X3 n=1 Tax=Pleurodeles waltl TaxID=8319 RepID=UPI0037099A40